MEETKKQTEQTAAAEGRKIYSQEEAFASSLEYFPPGSFSISRNPVNLSASR